MDLSSQILSHIASHSDVTIMTEFLVFFALAGVLISVVSHRVFFNSIDLSSDDLMENVERSIFAFLVFLLAITLGDVRATFSKAEDSVVNECLEIRQYVHLLDLQKVPFTQNQKRQLNSYLDAVVTDEWRSLSQATPRLSDQAERSITGLRESLRTNVQESGMSTYSDKIMTSLSKLENARLLRYQLATASSPRIFWVYIAMMLLLACIITGRTKLDKRRFAVLAAYFGALGMVIGLIMILEQPFRGETSVSSEPFRQVMQQITAAR
jgi:hypothetical protein